MSRRSERRGLLSSSCPRKSMDAHPGLAPGKRVLQTAGSSTLPCARKKWILRPVLPRHGFLYERSALLCSATEELDQDLGFKNGAPARTCTSSFGLRRTACTTLTLRELSIENAPCRCCPGVPCLEDKCAAVAPMARKMAAASGSAPDSPRLQRGADLSQLHSHEWSLRMVSRHGRPIIDRLLCY